MGKRLNSIVEIVPRDQVVRVVDYLVNIISRLLTFLLEFKFN